MFAKLSVPPWKRLSKSVHRNPHLNSHLLRVFEAVCIHAGRTEAYLHLEQCRRTKILNIKARRPTRGKTSRELKMVSFGEIPNWGRLQPGRGPKLPWLQSLCNRILNFTLWKGNKLWQFWCRCKHPQIKALCQTLTVTAAFYTQHTGVHSRHNKNTSPSWCFPAALTVYDRGEGARCPTDPRHWALTHLNVS